MPDMRRFLDLTGLGIYDAKIKQVIATGDANALAEAKKYFDDNKSLFEAAGTVKTAQEALQAAINAVDAKVNGILNGESIDSFADVETELAKYQLSGDYATKTEAQGYADAKDSAIAEAKKAGDDAQSDLNTFKDTVSSTYETKTDAAAKLTEAKDYTDDEIAKVDAKVGENASAIEVLEGQVQGLIEGTYDDSEVRGLIQGNTDAINTLSETHATDKATLEGSIALKASQEDLNAVSAVANAAVKQSDYDTKVAALEAEDVRIAGLVATEQARAEGVESGLNERLEEVEAFFKLAEGESLDTALDTLKEIQDYVTGEGAAADQMVLDIAANKKAIEDHIATDHDFAAADDALKSELEGQINAKADSSVVEGIDGRVEVVEGKVSTLEGKVSTLEGEMDNVQSAVSTKAEAQDLTNAISALEGVDTGLANRISALEAKHGDGEGTVESLIAAAKAEAIAEAKVDAANKDAVVLAESQKYVDAEIDKVELTIDTLQGVVNGKADASVVEGVSGKVTTLEGQVSTLESEMDEVQAAVATKAAASDLTALAGRVTVNEGAITTLNGEVDAVEGRLDDAEEAIEGKADASALDALTTRVSTAETNISTNAAALAKFTEITEAEINALFA